MKIAIIHSVLLLGYGIAATAQGQAPQFTISTVAGNGVAGFLGDGASAVSAELSNPLGVAIDQSGNIFIADFHNNVIRKVSPSGIMSTYAGTGVAGFSGDGGPATKATMNGPVRVVADGAGSLYIADTANYRIRKVSPSGIITTVAGNGGASASGDGGQATAAGLNVPRDLTVDAAGNLYIAGDSNTVRKVTLSGIITTVAGNGTAGLNDNGPATGATLNQPKGVAVDSIGTLYIADEGNERIRKVSGGIITTVAGNGTAGYSGDANPGVNAEVNNPTGVALDASGNLYIADQGNNRVRVLFTNGTIWTVAGTGAAGYGGDGGPAASAALDAPRALSISPAGLIYVADPANERIRLLTPLPQPPAIYTGGVVPACSKSTSVQSGAWISLYGTNLAQTTAVWNGDFPTKLAGSIVTINGKPAYIWFISPGQINVQAPDDSTVGAVAVVITTPYGSFSTTVTLAQYAPCFSVLDGTHAAAIVSTAGPGNTGAGYDIIGPSGAFSFPTRPLVPGEIVTLFGVGFGATNPAIPAGQLVTAPAQSTVYPQVSIGGLSAQVLYAGIVEAGLFQFNVVVPNAPSGDQQLLAVVGGVPTPITIVITMQ